jgi:hypothetical protein
LCFSAEASFASAAVLVPAGIYCARSALVKDVRWLPLSMLPIMAGLQQGCEGLVWLGLGRSDPDAVQAAALLFLFFAVCFWPFWIPFSVVCVAPEKRVKLFLGLVTLCGLAGGLGSDLPVLLDPELLHTEVVHHSIHYRIAALSAFAFLATVNGSRWSERSPGEQRSVRRCGGERRRPRGARPILASVRVPRERKPSWFSRRQHWPRSA